MRILMVGAGATGGFYGGRMALAGRDVTFLVRGRRAQQLRDHGLVLKTPHDEATLPHPQLITADELGKAAPFDVVLLSTKAYSLVPAMNDFAPAVGPETAILPLLNGMSHLDTLAGRFGKEKVLGGTVRIVADMDAEGCIHQMTDLDQFVFGELDGAKTPRAERMFEQFTVPGYRASLAPDILATMWQKWWILSTMGALGVVSGGTVGQAIAQPYGSEVIHAIIDETTSIAAANGYPADLKALEAHRERMTAPGSALTSSMFRDMTKGYPVEADHILGDLLGRANGVATPLLKGAYLRLKVYEAARESQGSNPARS